MMENESNVRQDLSTKRNNLSYVDHELVMVEPGNAKAVVGQINDKGNK